MCGIVGYVGNEQAGPILLDGLSRLEYRGYDSAGVAVYSQRDQRLTVHKAKGRLQVLSDMLQGGAAVEGTVGVGHTRWATHGAPSDENSHPQVSRSGRIAVVHNGIIENYAELKAFLQDQGVPFASETDTEVVAQLIEYFCETDQVGILEAVGRVLRRIQGAYALGIICADAPDQLIAVRKDSPLILGYGEGCSFLASDVTAIIRHTRDVSYMDDGEVAVLTKGLGHVGLEDLPVPDDDRGPAADQGTEADGLEAEVADQHGEAQQRHDGEHSVHQGNAEVLHRHGGQIGDDQRQHQISRLQFADLPLAHKAQAGNDEQIEDHRAEKRSNHRPTSFPRQYVREAGGICKRSRQRLRKQQG